MTIRIISDREVTLQMQIDVQGKALQKAMNEALALKSERDEYRQAADKMAWDHKVERDALRQQLAEAQAQIEASRKQEAVAWKHRYKGKEIVYYPYINRGSFYTEITPLYAAPVVADDVLKDAQRYRYIRAIGGVSLTVLETQKRATNEAYDAATDAAMGGHQ